MKAVVGLGNPGNAYRGTRHNIGFDVVDCLAERHGGVWKRGWRIKGQYCMIRVFGGDLLVVKPQTFVNRSGQCASHLRRRRGIAPDAMLVVVDDVELPPGRLRVRERGRAGGHNGLRSMEQELGTVDYPRIRVGVGGAPPGRSLTEHVLGRFSPAERDVVDRAVERAADAVECIFVDGVAAAMNTFNKSD